MKDWYTRKEVAEKLGVSSATVYHYAKQGKIKKIEDPHRLHREARYQKEEVDTLASEQASLPKGLKPNEVAKKLGLSVQTIYKYIQYGAIEAVSVPVGDDKINYVIPQAAFDMLKNTLRPGISIRLRKAEFYHAEYDLALYQQFSSQVHYFARVKKNERGEWGFYLLHNQKWVPIQEGKDRYKLNPVYEIHQEQLETKEDVTLDIPKTEDVLYPFIDYLYSVWGIENVGIREQEESLYITVKVGEKPFSIAPFFLQDLLPFVQEGNIQMNGENIIFKSAYRKTSLDLPVAMLSKIKILAMEDHISMSLWVERVLQAALEKKDE